jgi:hypothetical protein
MEITPHSRAEIVQLALVGEEDLGFDQLLARGERIRYRRHWVRLVKLVEVTADGKFVTLFRKHAVRPQVQALRISA